MRFSDDLFLKIAPYKSNQPRPAHGRWDVLARARPNRHKRLSTRQTGRADELVVDAQSEFALEHCAAIVKPSVKRAFGVDLAQAVGQA